MGHLVAPGKVPVEFCLRSQKFEHVNVDGQFVTALPLVLGNSAEPQFLVAYLWNMDVDMSRGLVLKDTQGTSVLGFIQVCIWAGKRQLLNLGFR